MGSLRNGAIRAKVLIWGAPGAGKTTTLTYVEGKLKSNQKGATQRTNLKDPKATYELLPVDLGKVKDVKIELDFMTVPGPWEHLAVRRRLLQGVDGIIFVASSSGSLMKENQKSLAELDEALKAMGRSLVTVPVVFQWMKQKAIGSMPSDEMAAKLNARIGAPAFSVTAEDQSGLLKAFATISKMVVKNVRDDYDQGKLVEPAPLEIESETVPPVPVPEMSATRAPHPPPDPEPSINPFADLAGELDEIPTDFANKLSSEGRTEQAESINESELAALLGEPPVVSASEASPPKPKAERNGAAKVNGSRFRLVSAGSPTLSADGVLDLPIRIGNEHGEEMAMTISVKVVPG